MTPRNSIDFLQDIISAINLTEEFIAGLTFETFENELI